MGVRRIVVFAAVIAFAMDFFCFARSDAAQSVSSTQSTPKADHVAKSLQPESRLLLIRGVDGENAKLVHSLPAGKHGFILSPGKPVDSQHLRDALRLWGTAAGQGDTVQITGLIFRYKQILVQINGGGKKHFNWRQHLQIGMGNLSTDPPPDTGPRQPLGGVLILDYGRALPDITPEDLKRDLGVMLDFSKQQSAAVNWIDTIPPKFKQAITDHKAMVGMDEDMVIAAVGRPDHKVRQREPDGKETEDWIYGNPPAKTVFVTFAGDNVIRVKEFN
jgi:hypothetical protein